MSELKFVSIPRLVDGSGQRVEPFGGPVAVLVDGLTASASECFTGGLQSLGRVRVFGETSMGQALPALFDRLPERRRLHPRLGRLRHRRRAFDSRGAASSRTKPSRRPAGRLLAGHDAPLEAALAWIDRGAKGGRHRVLSREGCGIHCCA